MDDARWVRVWHQAMTGAFADGKVSGHNKTIAFALDAPVAGEQRRVLLSNRRGSEPARIGALNVWVDGKPYPLTADGKRTFSVPAGQTCHTDAVAAPIVRAAKLELRLYYLNDLRDANMIEDGATLLKGSHVADVGPLPLRKPYMARLLGVANPLPAIEAVEVLTDEPARAIVAFGESISAMSKWTKPLARRLAEAYPGEYALLNSGISGNCLLYEVEGAIGQVFLESRASSALRMTCWTCPTCMRSSLAWASTTWPTSMTRRQS